jgi:hypothetical protein
MTEHLGIDETKKLGVLDVNRLKKKDLSLMVKGFVTNHSY